MTAHRLTCTLDHLLRTQPFTVWLALGDSISEYNHCSEGHDSYPLLLQHRLRKAFTKERFVLIEAAVSGRTLSQELASVGSRLQRFAPDLTTAMFGMNDCVRGAAHLPQFERELGEFIAIFRATGRQLVLLTQNPIDHGHHVPSVLARPDYGLYHRAICDVAAAEGATLIDLHAVWQSEVLDRSRELHAKMMHDGVHPNHHGHAFFAHHLARHLLPTLPETAPLVP
jgi:lysophospholipase L1-like esterase